MNKTQFFTTTDNCRIAYRLDGPEGKDVLVLANSIGTTMHMWDEVLTELTKSFRVLRYDIRGHGNSEAPHQECSLKRMGQDVIELLDFLKIPQAHFCGLSFGGLVGQWLGIHASERVKRLVLSNTSAYLGPADQWDYLIVSVLKNDDRADLAEIFLKNWFPTTLLEQKYNPTVEKFRSMLLGTTPYGFTGAFSVIRDTDLRKAVVNIAVPTLIIAGEHDIVTIASHGQQLAETIPNATFVTLPTAHMPHIELPEEFTRIVSAFLQD